MGRYQFLLLELHPCLCVVHDQRQCCRPDWPQRGSAPSVERCDHLYCAHLPICQRCVRVQLERCTRIATATGPTIPTTTNALAQAPQCQETGHAVCGVVRRRALWGGPYHIAGRVGARDGRRLLGRGRLEHLGMLRVCFGCLDWCAPATLLVCPHRIGTIGLPRFSWCSSALTMWTTARNLPQATLHVCWLIPTMLAPTTGSTFQSTQPVTAPTMGYDAVGFWAACSTWATLSSR